MNTKTAAKITRERNGITTNQAECKGLESFKKDFDVRAPKFTDTNKGTFKPLSPAEDIDRIYRILHTFPKVQETAKICKVTDFKYLPKLLNAETVSNEPAPVDTLDWYDLEAFNDCLYWINDNHELDTEHHNRMVDLMEIVEYLIEHYDNPMKAIPLQIKTEV